MKTKAAIATVIAFLLLPFHAAAPAQDDGTAQLDEITARVTAYQKGLSCFTADFTQTRYFADMDEEVVFRGRVWYSAPDKIRWSYLSPDESHLIINGKTAWMLVPELDQCDRYSVSENPKLEFFVSFFSKGLEALGRFGGSARSRPGTGVFDVMIKPEGEKKSLYESVEFEIARDGHMPSEIRVTETNGDWTRTSFAQADTKTAPDPALFDVPAKARKVK